MLYRYVDFVEVRLSGQEFPVLSHTGDDPFDGLFDVGQSFFPAATLRMTPRQNWAASYYEPIFIFFECH